MFAASARPSHSNRVIDVIVEDMDFRIVAFRLGSGDGLGRAFRGIFRIEGGERHLIVKQRPLAEAGRDFQNLRTHGQNSERVVQTFFQANVRGADKVRLNLAKRSNGVVKPWRSKGSAGSWSRSFPLQNHVALAV
jgi:hypothetical protein